MVPEGLLAVDKPGGMTSFDVIRRLKRATGTREIGHTGTLDPLATGVLCLCFAWSRKLIRFLDDDHKVYRTVGRLGIVTDTSDRDGQILAERPVEVTEDELRAVLVQFVGVVQQRPSPYSAIKIAGRRAYERARQGEAVETPLRTVRIDAIELEAFDLPRFTLRVACGKGTYVRTLCRDIGEALGCGAHVTELRRLESGSVTLERALTLPAIERRLVDGLDLPLVTPFDMLGHLPALALPAETLRSLACGQRPRIPLQVTPPTELRAGHPIRLTLEGSSELLAVAEGMAEEDGSFALRPLRVHPQALAKATGRT
ncbi:MAG: tRNA pseudouridine(55) synthase TruB [Bradymonadales bacterium]|nr:tRNA pseudouridine(55) synthase TruB [Bradymonadales bacterium]